MSPLSIQPGYHAFEEEATPTGGAGASDPQPGDPGTTQKFIGAFLLTSLGYGRNSEALVG
jgi:hypothetical protein